MLRNREMVATKLQRIAAKARTESSCRFTSLFHLMNVEMLRECFRELRKDAAAGIDKVTKKEYGLSLEKNLTALVENCTGCPIPRCQYAGYIFPNQGVVRNVLWAYPLLKISWCRLGWRRFYLRSMSRIS